MVRATLPCPVAIISFSPGKPSHILMASVQDHIESIERNERFLQHLKNEQNYPEWAVVAIFYVAIHYCRALLSHENLIVTSHPMASAMFHRKFGDRRCYTHLEMLKRKAESARYDNTRFSWQEVEALINGRLDPFKACVRRLASVRGLSLPA